DDILLVVGSDEQRDGGKISIFQFRCRWHISEEPGADINQWRIDRVRIGDTRGARPEDDFRNEHDSCRQVACSLTDDARGHTDRGVVWTHVVDHDRIRPNPRALSDAYVSNDPRAGADEHLIADHRALSSLCTNRHLMLDVYPLPTANFAVDHDPRRM